MRVATPIAYIAFNRPRSTSESFAVIRRQRPADLFLIADGPREDVEEDAGRCAQVREILEQVDWDCSVRRIYAESNLGLKKRIGTGLDQVFSEVDRAIVIEDDCVPADDFFSFCDTLLERYRDDERVGAITGDNFQDGIQRGDASYYFSKYMHCWGWATWARSWQLYDGDLSFWLTYKGSPDWQQLHPDPVERRYWERILDRTYEGEISTWDYPFQASVWLAGKLIVTPNVNLVQNIGFGPEATHTTGERPSSPVPQRGSLGRLSHPTTVVADPEADRYTFEHHCGGRLLRWPRRPLRTVPKLLARARRWLLSGEAIRAIRSGSARR